MSISWTLASGEISFGTGAVAHLGDIVRMHGSGRVLVVTDPNVAATDILRAVHRGLDAIRVGDFLGGHPEPGQEAILACVAEAKRQGAETLVAVGGGSNMDLAKVAAVILAHGGQPGTYLGEGKVPGPVLPLVCVPTTAGTGSEVSPAAVIKNPAGKGKAGILSPFLRPKAAVVDPDLSASCPRSVIAHSGLDALTHAIEAYTLRDVAEVPRTANRQPVFPGRHPFASAMAEKAIELIGANLKETFHHPENAAARSAMAQAAMLAGLAFSTAGLAIVHALEYPVGAATGLPHGAANALLLPAAMRFNLPARNTELARIASLLGLPVTGLGQAETAFKAIETLDQLRKDLGIPGRLRDFGVLTSQLKDFAEEAITFHRLMRLNPRPVTSDDLVAILQEVF
jgi:alcohol dehydrogenase class IV